MRNRCLQLTQTRQPGNELTVERKQLLAQRTLLRMLRQRRRNLICRHIERHRRQCFQLTAIVYLLLLPFCQLNLIAGLLSKQGSPSS